MKQASREGGEGSYRHPWNVTLQEAVAIQEHLAQEVITTDQLNPRRYVAGIDVGFLYKNTITQAAVAVLGYPELALCDQAIARRPTNFPYIPGLLSFREAPAVLEALDRLTTRPDLLLCDGQGLAHPRRFGIACHIGLLSDIPAVGVAKSRLVGDHEPLAAERGARQPIMDGGEVIGMVLRTRANVKPVYVSIGHRISLETAAEVVLACAPRYRLPEPIRQADRLASSRSPRAD